MYRSFEYRLSVVRDPQAAVLTRESLKSSRWPSNPREARLLAIMCGTPVKDDRTLRRLAWLALVVPLVACGSGEETGIEVADLPESVTFAEHVAPIIYENCTPCHNSNGRGTFPLRGYEDVRAQALPIAAATAELRMPPWLPAPGQHPFAGARNLTTRQIAMIRRWVDQGVPEGDPTITPEPPSPVTRWQLGEPDLVITMPEPYLLAGGGADLVRNFVLPVSITGRWYVRAIDFDPGEGRVVDRALINVDRTRSSRRRDANDSESGFDGMFAGSERAPPAGFFAGWTPGKVAYRGREGLSWRLEPGTDIVLQLHLRPDGVDHLVQASVGLYLTDEPPSLLSRWLTVGSRQIDIPAGESSVVVEGSYVLPVDVELLAVYPQVHYLGSEIVGVAKLPDGTTDSIIHIPRWNFNHRDVYRYDEPVPLPKGTRLTVRVSFDNSDHNPMNPNRPPKRVTYRPGFGDEAANLLVQVLVRDSTDLGSLGRHFSREHQRDLVVGLESLLEAFPDNAAYHNELGEVRQAERNIDEAKAHYRRALELAPDYLEARFNLGRALQLEGNLAAAGEVYARLLSLEPDHVPTLFNLGVIVQLEGDAESAILTYIRVIELEPTHAGALNNLGNTLVEAGRPGDAIPYYQAILVLRPDHVDALINLGNLYRETGDLEKSILHYRAARAADPRYALGRYNLGRALLDSGQVAEGIDEMREAVRLEPQWHVALAALSWTLATHAEGSVRQPGEAVELGRRAADLTGFLDPVVLDVLAAAYAADEQFDRAVETASRGVELALDIENEELVGQIRARLDLYRRRQAYHEPAR